MNDQWESVSLRIQKEAKDTLQNNSSDGLAIITSHILVDSTGNPVVWVVQDGRRVEPSRSAKDILMNLLG